MTVMAPLEDGVVVTTRGEVARGAASYAREKVRHVLRFASAPVLYAKVVLTAEPDPARARPAVAEVNVDVDGRPVRVLVAGATMHEAVDLLEARLRRRLEKLEGRARAEHLRHRDHSWHHGDAFAHRPTYFDRAPDEREIVRRKSLAPAPMTIHEAADHMELLDHDFFLYVNEETGHDTVLQRLPGGRYALVAPTSVSSTEDATALLDLADEPFVFFVDPETGRGRVLYRRYDGHYGLITAGESAHG